MKRFWIAVVMVGVMAVVLMTVASADSNGKFFLGLWQGIGLSTGAVATTSITENNADGELIIRITATFFNSCQEPGENGRGVIQATGTAN